MAPPTYVQQSTGTTDATGAFSHTGVATGAIGDIVILQIVVDGTGAISWGTITATNIENLAGTDNAWTEIGTFNIGSPTAAQQRFYIGRRLSASAAPTFSASANTSGDDVYMRMYEFTNVNTGTALADIIENGTAGGTANEVGTGTTVSDANVTTLGVDRLSLNFVGANDDISLTQSFGGTAGLPWKQLGVAYADAAGTDAAMHLHGAYPGIATYLGTNSNVSHVQGATGASEMQAQSFLSGAGGDFNSIVMDVSKVSSPTDDVVVEIQTNSGGVPSGTVVGASSTPVSGASLSASGGIKIPSFDASGTLSASTTYHIVVRRTGARDTTNRYSLNGSNPGGYSDGQNIQRDSGTWAAAGSGDTTFSIQSPTGSTVGGQTHPILSAGWGVVGFALIGTTAGAPPAATSDETGWINARRTPRRRTIQRL